MGETYKYENGETMTMQKAAQFLKSIDRAKREEVYVKVNERRMQDRDALDKLYDELIALRQKIARNAGFKNYRDYSKKYYCFIFSNK